MYMYFLQATYWGSKIAYQRIETSSEKQEPTIDKERFSMLFKYLSPMTFGDHSNAVATRVFNVSYSTINTSCVFSLCIE